MVSLRDWTIGTVLMPSGIGLPSRSQYQTRWEPEKHTKEVKGMNPKREPTQTQTLKTVEANRRVESKKRANANANA